MYSEHRGRDVYGCHVAPLRDTSKAYVYLIFPSLHGCPPHNNLKRCWTYIITYLRQIIRRFRGGEIRAFRRFERIRIRIGRIRRFIGLYLNTWKKVLLICLQILHVCVCVFVYTHTHTHIYIVAARVQSSYSHSTWTPARKISASSRCQPACRQLAFFVYTPDDCLELSWTATTRFLKF